MKLPLKFTRRTVTGLGLIYIAGLGWAGELLIPFLPIAHKPAIFLAVLIISELIFVAGVATLGKPVYEELKTWLMAYLRSRQR